MKTRTIQLDEATQPLANYVREMDGESIVVMKKARPVAVIMSMKNVDAESFSMSQNPKFLAIIKRSRRRQKREGGLSSKEMRRKLEGVSRKS